MIIWLEELFSRYGNPDQLVSDNGLQFISTEFSNFLHMHGIDHIRMSVYNPSENGLVEVFNRILKFSVQCFQMRSQTSQQNCLQQSCASQPWKEGILELLKAYRATLPKPGTKSPAECFFSCPFRLDFQIPKELLKPLASK